MIGWQQWLKSSPHSEVTIQQQKLFLLIIGHYFLHNCARNICCKYLLALWNHYKVLYKSNDFDESKNSFDNMLLRPWTQYTEMGSPNSGNIPTCIDDEHKDRLENGFRYSDRLKNDQSNFNMECIGWGSTCILAEVKLVFIELPISSIYAILHHKPYVYLMTC